MTAPVASQRGCAPDAPARAARRQQWRAAAAPARSAPLRTLRSASTASAAAAAAPWQCRRQQRQVIARTSADWWEDEEEFDAITEILEPKRVFLTTPAGCRGGAAAAAALGGSRLVTAFASGGAQEAAESLWQQLGRAGPPLFLKVRTRPALGELEAAAAGAAAAAAEGFWGELLGQSWRTELDAGLGKREEGRDEEELLIVADAPCLGHLLTALSDHSSDHSDHGGGGDAAVAAVAAAAGGSLLEVAVGGWNQGVAAEQQKVLESWRQLAPRLVQRQAA